MAVYTDDFNRANTQVMGSNWTILQENDNGGFGFKILSNQLVWDNSASAAAVMRYNNTFTADQYSQFKVVTSVYQSGSGDVRYCGPGTRLNGSGGTFNDGYVATAIISSDITNVNNITLYNGGSGSLVASGFANVSANDIIKITSVGTTHTYYRNGSSQGSGTDATFNTTNAAGVYAVLSGGGSPPATMDDWEGGDVGAAAGQPTMRRFGRAPIGLEGVRIY